MFDQIRFIPANQLRQTAWENGAGHEYLLASATCGKDSGPGNTHTPDSLGPANQLWSVSTAVVDRPGLLPDRPGLDCMLMLTAGGPLQLVRQDTGQENTLQTGSRLYFAGETRQLASPPTAGSQYFMLAVRRKLAHGMLEMRRGKQQLSLRPGISVLHCVCGAFRAGLPDRLGGQIDMKQGDTLEISLDYIPAFALALSPLSENATMADARINLYPGA